MLTILKIVKVVLCIILAIIAFFSLVVFLLIKLFTGSLIPSPEAKIDPAPEIQYGEFPFKLVYELNGEEFIIEDTLICEYNGLVGAAFAFDNGSRSRDWKSYLASDEDKKENCPLLLELEDGTKIYYSTNRAAYYMGDGRKKKSVYDPFNGVFAIGPSSTKLHIMGAKEMLKYLGIVLIEWEIAPPIVNEFK